jgi:hypothetical protein
MRAAAAEIMAEMAGRDGARRRRRCGRREKVAEAGTVGWGVGASSSLAISRRTHPTHTISRLSKRTILRRRQNEREGKRKRRRDDVEEPDPEAGLAEDGGNGREWEGKGFEMNVC